MGGWKLEVGKMVLYMMFPVAMFHYFNQPQYYEEYITKLKQEVFPPERRERTEEVRRIMSEVKMQKTLNELKELEELKNKNYNN